MAASSFASDESDEFSPEAPSLDDSGVGTSPFKNPAHFFKTSPLNSSDANGDHVTTACIQASEPEEPHEIAACNSYTRDREVEELRRRVRYLEIENSKLRQKLETVEKSKSTDAEKTELEAELEYNKRMYKHTREVEESNAKRMKLMEEKVERLESQAKLPQTHDQQLPSHDTQLLQHDTQPHDAQLPLHNTQLLQHDTQPSRQDTHQSVLFNKPEEENKSPNSALPILRKSNSRKKDKRPESAKF